MLISTSKDVLFIVLAFCALWLTVFLSWLLFYVIAIVRDAEQIARQVKNAVEKIDHLAHIVHDKVETFSGSFALLAQTAKEMIVWAMDQREKKKPSRKK